MTQIITSVKGTRDFYPEDMAVRNWIYGKMRDVAHLFGYVEYDGPFLERIDLYAAKSGEELVKEQAFVFPDRGGDLITLRPELTPSLARMIAQKQKQLVFPQRWWSFGPFWRYERPQKGRTREFFQWNVDMLGSDATESDAELIAVCATFFKKVGLSSDQVKIFINSRELMDSVLIKLGIQPELKMAVFRLIDRKDKLSSQEWQEFALILGLTENQFEGLKIALNDKHLWKESNELTLIMGILERMDLGEYVTFDPQIIRGLDYYTGVVFEARDMGKEGRAILGGGHYGNLVGDVGGELLPGVGFAMGDVMLRLVLEKYLCLPEFDNTSAKVLVTVFDETLYPDSLEIANILRISEIPTILVNENQKLQKQFKYADRIGVPIVLVLGPEEKNNKKVTVKNLKTRQQENVLIENLVTTIKDQLAYELAV
ncbi:MAG: histidine--tRNA ligase [Chloroflexi bacterium HGW-Chloroflexi-3]|nr:MAG: histidine--tRNA ligase [Chloroflexi bacterium HGW-Chloroflexi-3]